MSLVERNGDARSFHVERVNHATLKPMLMKHIDAESRIVTDNANVYNWTRDRFAGGHESVNHQLREYARGGVTTNTMEGYFSILKRGLIGTYHHVGASHLPAYLHEFDFRYNTREMSDSERTRAALVGIHGKRLYYN